VSLPATPVEAYKAIIDQLATDTSRRGAGTRIRRAGIFSKAPAHAKFNQFIDSLDSTKRELLAEMLQEEREGAIHDALADLTWWITTRKVGLTYDGLPMPTELSGMGLHGDYVGRREGWDWPE
jgi:hypothetical protein